MRRGRAGQARRRGPARRAPVRLAADRRHGAVVVPGSAALRLSIPHYFHFEAERELVGDRLEGSARWDALRLRSRGAFSLPATRAELEARADGDAAARGRAQALDDLAGPRALASYGVGAAAVEQWLARLRPGRRLIVTEFAPGTVRRLSDLFPELDVRRHDLRGDPPLPADLHVFHRIDTELDDQAFREVLQRFHQVPVILVATELLTPRAAVRELRSRLRPGATRAGLVRSGGAFEALWEATHDARPVAVHDLHGWLLEPRH